MKDKIIYLSPSTQEKNFFINGYGSEEKVMNDITNYIEKGLKDKGYVVYRNNPGESLNLVIKESNEIKPDAHIAIHSNASNGNSIGPEIYTNKKDSPSDKLANYIYKEILNIYYDKNAGRGVKYTNDLAEIRDVESPTVLLEIAFHDNAKDAKWIIDNEEEIAKAIIKAIDAYFEEK